MKKITPLLFLLLCLKTSFSFSALTAQEAVLITGDLKKWHPLTISFVGPLANETDVSPNPFLDYRLQVRVIAPSGHSYGVPGFFAGDGNGNGSGNIWQIRFSPDEAGEWQYQASFRHGQEIAIDLSPDTGQSTSFDGISGTFAITGLDPTALGFLKWGRLEYQSTHYLKFHDGPYWIKGGTDSPENFLGYRGFDNTSDQGGIISPFLHEYLPHIIDWKSGDPDFVGAETGYEGKGIIGALNYLGEKHVNSIYFLPMNLGGDGQETYPFTDTTGDHFGNTHYDISKLHQWNIVLEHAQRQGIALHFVLTETEPGNHQWLDGGELGVERKLFYREMTARFGYLLAIKWNLSEENPFPLTYLHDSADYIQFLDWSKHPLSVHTHPNRFDEYYQLVGDPRFAATSIQYAPERANEFVEMWRNLSSETSHPWVVDMDENNPANIGLINTNANELRKLVLYTVYFSGGNIEWYAGYHDLPLGGDIQLEDFRTREAMWNYMWYARQFMEENLSFWEMVPKDELLTGEAEYYGGGQVFTKPGEVYAIYLPNGEPTGILDLSEVPGITFDLSWYNPRTGGFEGTAVSVAGGSQVDLGAPPSTFSEDWVVLLKAQPPSISIPIETPTAHVTPSPIGVESAIQATSTSPIIMIQLPTVTPQLSPQMPAVSVSNEPDLITSTSNFRVAIFLLILFLCTLVFGLVYRSSQR